MSRWRSVTSSVPWGFILGQVLLNVFLNDKNNGIEYTPREFVDDTKLSDAVNMLEGQDAIQRPLD